jgi:hypothetical protein
MDAGSRVPVLMLVFNRPDKTRLAFERIRRARPERLFIAADGPRAERPQDAQLCEQTRAVVSAIDWPCTVETLFREHNLGCKRAVEEGIGWFFSQVEAGIIIEDDILPAASFFPYCAELLERYRDAHDVMMISGTNILGQWHADRQSYHFSYNSNIWGWATWRRAWDRYDPTLSVWGDPATKASIRQMLGEEQFRHARKQIDSVYSGHVDTWDFAWNLAMLAGGGVVALPAKNLVSNIGFGRDATHTKNEWSDRAGLPTHELTFPLTHPATRAPDRQFDRLVHLKNTSTAGRLAALLPYPLQQPARAAFHKLTAAMPRRSS